MKKFLKAILIMSVVLFAANAWAFPFNEGDTVQMSVANGVTIME